MSIKLSRAMGSVSVKRNGRYPIAASVVLLVIVTLISTPAFAMLSGAIFTTLADGSRVNANIYDKMEDVYLDGGPGLNAPSEAAALPQGNYYFQVTDPSGKILLSTDPVKCRKFRINSYGVIDYVYSASCLQKGRSSRVYSNCTHLTGIDVDHSDLGAVTIQLMPYQKTPNNGGVYKAWATPVERFVGDPNQVDNLNYFHGFVPAWSKTDNYKVRRGKPCDPRLKVRKFDDSNANGVWDINEVEITGWPVDVNDPLNITNHYFTPVEIPRAVPKGWWVVTEEMPAGWLQTALYIDGAPKEPNPVAQVEFLGLCDETHEIIFGNIQLGSVTACKFYDRNANGVNDNEPPVAGILFVLDGNDILGSHIHQEEHTGQDGCVAFADLLPGSYTLCEIPPPGNWVATTNTCASIILPEGGSLTYPFGNICEGQADFDTKGYWHNKNGLDETLLADFVCINSLLPWEAPSSYFDAGDEPIDGNFADGSPVPAAKGPAGETIAPEGSPWAEQSYFLIDRNAGGDPREQLAQQLDAFIMNVRHRLDGDAAIQIPGGDWVVTSVLIEQAISIWAGGSASEQTAMSDLLDTLNNSDAVRFIHYNPCPVVYP